MSRILPQNGAEQTRPLDNILASFKHPCWSRVFSALVFCVTMIVLSKLGTSLEEWRDVIASENGPVERMSAAAWFMGSSWCLGAAWSNQYHRVEWLIFTTLLLLFGLRELDAHVWSTGWNLDALANYWNEAIPINERLLVIVMVVLPCIGLGAILYFQFWEKFVTDWTLGKVWVGYLMMGCFLLVLCLTLDKVGAYTLPILGIGEEGQMLFMGIEEILEYVLSVYSVAVLWPYWQLDLQLKVSH